MTSSWGGRIRFVPVQKLGTRVTDTFLYISVCPSPSGMRLQLRLGTNLPIVK